MRRVRRIRAGPADRPARLLRALRAPASRPGVRRNRRLQRERDPRLQGYGPGLPGVRRQIPVDPRRPPGGGARTLRDHGTVGLGERPAHARPHSVPRAGGWPARLRRRGGPRRRRHRRHRPQRKPHQHDRAHGRDPRLLGERPARGARPRLVDRHCRHDGALGRRGRPQSPRRRPLVPAALERGVLSGLHGRDDALRRPRPPRLPPSRPRPIGGGMGRRLGDGGPGHSRCGLRARSRPRRAPGRRRRRRALLEMGRAQPLGMRLRVRLPRPARHGDPRALGQFGPPGDGAHPRRGASGGRRPGHRDPPTRALPRPSATPKPRAYPTGRDWSRTPTSGAPSSSRPSCRASAGSASSSTRCAR